MDEYSNGGTPSIGDIVGTQHDTKDQEVRAVLIHPHATFIKVAGTTAEYKVKGCVLYRRKPESTTVVKSLGQIAYETFLNSAGSWEHCDKANKSQWQKAAEAVAAVVNAPCNVPLVEQLEATRKELAEERKIRAAQEKQISELIHSINNRNTEIENLRKCNKRRKDRIERIKTITLEENS